MIKVDVTNRIEFPIASLPDVAARRLKDEFTHDNPDFHRQRSMGYSTHAIARQIKTWRTRNVGGEWYLSLPRGGMSRLREVFNAYDLDYETIDSRSTGEEMRGYVGDWVTPRLFPEPNFPLWPHQQDIVDVATDREQGIIRAMTGAGKTWALVATIAAAQVPACVVVWDGNLFEQWRSDIEKMLGVSKRDQGVIRGKTRNLRAITVAMQQTMNRMSDDEWKRVSRAFGFVACDEVQRYSSSTFVKTIDRFAAKYRIGVSADESRKDRKEFLIYDMFGHVIHEVDKVELEQQGIIHDVAIRAQPTQFTAPWYADARDMGGKPDWNRLLNEMTADEDRNGVIVALVEEALSDDEVIVVLTHRVAHAIDLDSMITARGIRTGRLIGGTDNREEFTETKRRLQAGDLKVAVGTYTAFGVGHNVPVASVAICATPIHTNRQFAQQVRGRVCRASEGKTGATMYVVWDPYVYGRQPLLNYRRWNNDVRVRSAGRWVDVDNYLRG